MEKVMKEYGERKYKCITVKSVTYAQKAKSVLLRKGIDAYLSRREVGDGGSCLWCVKVQGEKAERAYGILLESAIPVTGEIYEM